MVKNPAANAGDTREESSIPELGRFPQSKKTATYSSTLAWRIPRTEGPSGLPSMGSQRVGHNEAAEHTGTHVHAQSFRTMPRTN